MKHDFFIDNYSAFNASDDHIDQSCSSDSAYEGDITKDIKFSSLEDLMINSSYSISFED